MKELFRLVIFLVFVFITPLIVYGASSCVPGIEGSGPYIVYNLEFLTDASGDFDATDADATTQQIDGVVLLVEWVPSTVSVPTDNSDITLRDENGTDITGETGVAGSENYDGVLANLSNTVPKRTQCLLNGNYQSIPIHSPLTLDVFNAGNSKGGKVRIHCLIIK